MIDHLGDCVQDDEAAEEAIMIEAIKKAGKRLGAAKWLRSTEELDRLAALPDPPSVSEVRMNKDKLRHVMPLDTWMYVREIAERLTRGSILREIRVAWRHGGVYSALNALEDMGEIVSRWHPDDATYPRRRQYRRTSQRSET